MEGAGLELVFGGCLSRRGKCGKCMLKFEVTREKCHPVDNRAGVEIL
jgi:hypothetical protein